MFQLEKENKNIFFKSESLRQEDLDNIALLTSIICNTPISLINILDGETLIVKSKIGWDVERIPVEIAFCNETITRDETIIIEDTLQSKFANNKNVTHAPSIRFYVGAPLKTAEGKIIGTICIMDNKPRTVSHEQINSLEIFAKQVITHFELIRKHKELDDHRNLLGKILDAMPLAVTVTQADGKVYYSNSKSAQLLGKPVESHLVPDRIASTYNLKFAGEREPYAAWRSPTYRASKGEASYTSDIEVHTKDNITPIQLWASPIMDEGKISHVITVFDDITPQKEIEKQLMDSENKYRNLIEDMGDVVYKTDRAGNFTFVNNRVTKLVGYKPEELLGKHYTILIHPGHRDRVESFYYQQFKDKREETLLEFPVIARNGETIWVEQSVRIWWEAEDKIKNFHCMVRDIEARKQTEAALIEAKRFAEEAKQLQEIFLANMSHEIRTPMNGVLGVANLLAETELTSKQKEYVDAIKLSGGNLMVIINDILDLTKIKSGKITFEKIAFNLDEVIKNAIYPIQNRAVEKDLNFAININPDLETQIVGDPTRLSQVLINFVGNAEKFTEKGYVRIDISKVSENIGSQRIKFKIEDSGIGIPSAKLKDIFEKFTQANSDTTRKFGGTGLGLSISKQLIELQNGTIGVESTIGVGSTFSFELVFDKIPQVLNKIEALIDQTTKSLEGIRILLAEDNEINQMVAVDTLERWNAKVEVAENGKIVLQKMELNTYDLILMDLQMPEMGGEECTKIIRSKTENQYSSVPIIAMTASAFKKEKEKCISIGMNGYVSKPFYPEDLYSEISIVLNNKAQLK